MLESTWMKLRSNLMKRLLRSVFSSPVGVNRFVRVKHNCVFLLSWLLVSVSCDDALLFMAGELATVVLVLVLVAVALLLLPLLPLPLPSKFSVSESKLGSCCKSRNISRNGSDSSGAKRSKYSTSMWCVSHISCTVMYTTGLVSVMRSEYSLIPKYSSASHTEHTS